jgi:EAL domain-containing protein (putative c-di-GMP-specific phosphodiesterase class I)/ActR/RegA family two-component response regulator
MMEIAQLRFLVVEDQGFQRWLTANLLRELGAKSVYSASDGVAALEILQGADPPVDVVVSDLDMPGMDGMELIRHIAEQANPAALIVVSSMDASLIASVGTMARAYGVDLLGMMQKPLTAKKLQPVLASYRGSHPRGKPAEDESDFTREEVAHGLRRKEFEVFFQPKVEVQSRKVQGAEALVRWRHPAKGLLFPKAFIEKVEESELIDALTEIVVKDAAENCREWRRANIDMSVSVNLSALSLSDVTLADRMTAIVRATNLETRHLVFELTESAAGRDLGMKLENLSRLRMKGFGLSIDDFGTGYSSQQRLARIPFTELKIDQSFVNGAATVASGRAMVESSLELAQKLGITAVAEGVEAHDDWELLAALGCPLAQGYYIAHAMQAGEFMEWVRERRQASA